MGLWVILNIKAREDNQLRSTMYEEIAAVIWIQNRTKRSSVNSYVETEVDRDTDLGANLPQSRSRGSTNSGDDTTFIKARRSRILPRELRR